MMKLMVMPMAATLLLVAPTTAQRLSVTIGAQASYGSPHGSGRVSIGVAHDSAYGRFGSRRSRRLPRSHGAARHTAGMWTPGRHVTRYERVWSSGTFTKQWVSPVYRDHGQARAPWSRPQRGRVLVRAGYWRQVMQPGHYERRPIQVWRPGHWS